MVTWSGKRRTVLTRHARTYQALLADVDDLLESLLVGLQLVFDRIKDSAPFIHLDAEGVAFLLDGVEGVVLRTELNLEALDLRGLQILGAAEETEDMDCQ